MTSAPLNSAFRERELLTVCGRVHLDAAAQTRLARLLDAPVDWPSTVSLAMKHGLVPLLHKHLCETQPARVPADVIARLAQLSHGAGRHSLHMTAELLRIAKAMEAEGVMAVAIKGPALAQSLYDSIALRCFGDLDLLTSPDEIERAARVLRGLGYVDEFCGSEADSDIHMRSYHNFCFASAATGVRVELHHRLTNPCFQSEKQVRDIIGRATPIPLAGSSVRTLSPEDQFLYLCVHGVKHLWERLEWICAVSAMARGSMVEDWEVVASRARDSGNERIVFVGLLLAEALTGVPIPEALAPMARRDRVAHALAEEARRRVCVEEKQPEVGELFFYNLRAHKMRERCVYCWFALTTPTLADVETMRLPRPLYGVSRPLRIVKTYAASMLHTLFHRQSAQVILNDE